MTDILNFKSIRYKFRYKFETRSKSIRYKIDPPHYILNFKFVKTHNRNLSISKHMLKKNCVKYRLDIFHVLPFNIIGKHGLVKKEEEHLYISQLLSLKASKRKEFTCTPREQ